MKVKVFFCYAREDEAFLNKLKAHLKPLQRQGRIDVWYDRDISAGAEWQQEINEHLNTAHIILLLVSPDFMNSDYVYGTEMKRALERHEAGKAHVIPVILRHVYWQEILGKLQALPTDGKPVKSWQDEDEAFFKVVEGINKVVDEVNRQYWWLDYK
jgi:TIR domain